MKKRKIYVKLPGNRLSIVIKRMKPKIARCGNCGKELQGIKKLSTNKFKNLAKSKKRPNRAYGGNLCSKCSREEILRRLRG